MQGSKLIPLKINLDLAAEYMPVETARFIKNLSSYVGATDEYAGIKEGQNELKLKPLQSNEVYVTVELPEGDNFCIGAKGFPITNEVYVFVWNSKNNHCIYRVNGSSRTSEIVYVGSDLNFQLKPEYFIGEAQCQLDVHKYINPDTGEETIKKDLYWTDGFNYQGFLRVDDSIATNGFDANKFTYFNGNYDKSTLVRMGLPTPKDCIEIDEIPIQENYKLVSSVANISTSSIAPNIIILPNTIFDAPQYTDRLVISSTSSNLSGTFNVINTTVVNNYYHIQVQETVPTIPIAASTISLYILTSNYGVSNNLLFNTWQFRVRYVDVWGRPSEWGIISDMYVAGINDCISTSSNLPSCLNLTFDAGSPIVNTIDIAYRNCNTDTWKKDQTLFLYNGSNLGEWWKRERNSDVNYNPTTNKITYVFCRNQECDIVDVAETNRLENPLPKRSQVLLKLNDNIALVNNKDKFNPFPKETLDNISIDVISPTQNNPDTRNITIYVAIWGAYSEKFQQVSKNGNTNYVYGGIDVDQFPSYFTYFQYIPRSGINVFPAWCISKKQYFNNDSQTGFCGILVNGQSAISSQVYVDASGSLVDDINFRGYELSPIHKTFQKFEFNNVPKGKYIFRITSQTADPSLDNSYRETSTPIWGLCPFNKNNNYQIDVTSRNNSCELLVDCCDSDYDTMNHNEMLVIADLASTSVVAQCGYFYESKTDNTRWELLDVQQGDLTSSLLSSLITDANGFYWVSYLDPFLEGTAYLVVLAQLLCVRRFGDKQIPHSFDMTFEDEYMVDFFKNVNDVASICDTVEIKGRVLLDGTSIGVSNALVALTRGGIAVTDDDGFFTIIAHDDNVTGTRNDTIIISGGVCSYQSSSGCIPSINIVFKNCDTRLGESCSERIIATETVLLTYKPERGLLSGGTYVPYINGYDWLGRKTYSQPLPQLTIPSIIQTQAIAPSTLNAIINPNATFPNEIEYITFSLTEETTISNYLSWIVDRFEFIDNTGAINNIAPTQIKIYYQSIIEFNSVNNFNTTTAWQFIPTGSNTPVISDKVQFFINGDGKFFTKDIVALVKYDSSGQYFTIDYTSQLKDLKQNALIRLIRPKECTGTEPNYEVCSPVNIVNNKAVLNTVPLNAFDTYYLSREIPVPAPLSPPPPITIGNASYEISQIATTQSNVTTYVVPAPVATVLELRDFGFRFEHNSASNFWGDGCKNIGRINVKNPYECELLSPNQIAISGVLSPDGQLNYLQYFDDAQKTIFDIKDTSGIVAGFVEQGMVWFLTQFDNFLVGYGDNLVRAVGGQLQVPSAANTFGNPERKIGDLYGCNIKDKTSIGARNGLIIFPDRSRGELLKYNFNKIESLTKQQCDAWFRLKCKRVQSDEGRYFSHVINPVANEYYITDFSLSKSVEIQAVQAKAFLAPIISNLDTIYGVEVNDPIYGNSLIFEYKQKDTDTTNGIFIASFISQFNQYAKYGYKAVAYLDYGFYIVAPIGYGSSINGNLANIFWNNQGTSNTFKGGIYGVPSFFNGGVQYINQERTYNANINETVSFDIQTKDLKAWHSFIAERGAYLDGDILNCQMFTFKQGQPYSHLNVNTNNSYNTYYGVVCERVLEIIANQPPFKKKKFNNLAVYCKQSKYFSDLITTETGQKSYLMLNDFQMALYFTNASFNQDINTPTDPNTPGIDNKLITEGRPMYGEWMSIRLIGEPLMNDKYSEMLGVIVESVNFENT